MDNFSRSQIIRKAVVPTRGGVVAAAHRRAAEVGATVLDAGGDAGSMWVLHPHAPA
jgi:gamma-glutamyltranspeptidase/glutathione hydrolase